MWDEGVIFSMFWNYLKITPKLDGDNVLLMEKSHINCITFRLIKASKNSWDGPIKIIIMLMVIGYQTCNNSKEKRKAQKK